MPDQIRHDAERLLAALDTEADGTLFDDEDQGWEVEIAGAGPRLYIRHADPEAREELACIWCDRDTLMRQIEPLRARLVRILAGLRAALGADYWSRAPIAHRAP